MLLPLLLNNLLEDAGSGAMNGSCTVTFSAEGAISGRGVIIGESTITFDGSGSITGRGSLIGSSLMQFTPTGDIEGLGALIGALNVIFSGVAKPLGESVGRNSLYSTWITNDRNHKVYQYF